MLFEDDFERTGGAITPYESTFEYLQRSNRPECIQRCQWINEWFDELPSNVRSTFDSRIKAKEIKTFNGALFELQVHRMLRKLNCSTEIERNFPATENKIDFFARKEDQILYIEATVCGFGQGFLAENSNEYDAVEKIRKNLKSPHSDVWLETKGELRTTLGKKRVVKPIRGLLTRYSPDQVRHIHSRLGLQGAPFTEIIEGDWVLKASLEPPRVPSSGGQTWGPSRTGAVDGSTPLLESPSTKARKWKNSDFKGTPFLIAVNACHSEFDWYEGDDVNIRRALFANPDAAEQPQEFTENLSCVNGVIVFGNAVLVTKLAPGLDCIKTRI